MGGCDAPPGVPSLTAPASDNAPSRRLPPRLPPASHSPLRPSPNPFRRQLRPTSLPNSAPLSSPVTDTIIIDTTGQFVRARQRHWIHVFSLSKCPRPQTTAAIVSGGGGGGWRRGCGGCSAVLCRKTIDQRGRRIRRRCGVWLSGVGLLVESRYLTGWGPAAGAAGRTLTAGPAHSDNGHRLGIDA